MFYIRMRVSENFELWNFAIFLLKELQDLLWLYMPGWGHYELAAKAFVSHAYIHTHIYIYIYIFWGLEFAIIQNIILH